MNIYDIARLADVSTATVSRVINGGPVSRKTRARVNEVLKKTGYQPNPYAQGMNIGSMKLVGILVAQIDDLYYMRAVSVLEQRLRAMDYDIILYSVGEEMTGVKRYIRSLCSRKVDAIFTIGSIFRKAEKDLFAPDGIPILTINLETENEACYNIFCDDASAVEQAVCKLYAKGRRTFLYLNDSDTANGTAKLTGFYRGLAACGLSKKDQFVYNCPRTIEAAHCEGKRILSENPHISAVLTSVDELAVGVIKAAFDLGRSVPDSLSVMGYDNSILSECSTPRISTVDNKVDELCILGASMMLDLLSGKPVAKKYILNSEFIEKETT
ncbi:MAG: LacI family transcriptional regulator [Clostridiales bacterium]|nr:LacI family transcriptional regulator [Clostridiales bacterium]